MKNIKMKNTGEQLKERLSEELGTKVVVNYINPDTKVGQSFEVCIYENDYDYKIVYLNYFTTGMSIRNYINCVKYALDNKKFIVHKASAEEIYISKLLERYECESLYLNDGYLYSTKSEDCISTNDIEKLEYDALEHKLVVMEYLEGKITVCFLNGTISLEEDKEEIPLVKFNINKDIQDLKDYVKEINKLAKENDFEYVIINNVILEINYKLKTVLNLCNIENINKISFENDELIIEAYINEEEMETMFLTECGCMF